MISKKFLNISSKFLLDFVESNKFLFTDEEYSKATDSLCRIREIGRGLIG